MKSAFILNIPLYKKRIFTKYFFLFLLNTGFLFYGYLQTTSEKLNYIMICLFVLTLIGLIFWRNAYRQLRILKETVYEFEGNILKHFGTGNTCSNLELDTIESLKMDHILGFKRLLVKTNTGQTHTYSHIEELDQFIENLEKKTNRKFEVLKRNKWELSAKFIAIYLPSVITFYFTRIPEYKISIKVLYLIFTLNTIFLIHNLSESKFEGGLGSRVSRRMIFILIAFFCYMFYSTFYAEF